MFPFNYIKGFVFNISKEQLMNLYKIRIIVKKLEFISKCFFLSFSDYFLIDFWFKKLNSDRPDIGESIRKDDDNGSKKNFIIRKNIQENNFNNVFFIDANDSVTIANTNANSQVMARSEMDTSLNDISNKKTVKKNLKLQ